MESPYLAIMGNPRKLHTAATVIMLSVNTVIFFLFDFRIILFLLLRMNQKNSSVYRGNYFMNPIAFPKCL
jgi:hypothetical protein